MKLFDARSEQFNDQRSLLSFYNFPPAQAGFPEGTEVTGAFQDLLASSEVAVENFDQLGESDQCLVVAVGVHGVIIGTIFPN